jgi:hypothetical protein
MIVLATLLTIIFVFLPTINETPVRIVLGLFLVLFAIGYSLIAVLFPKKNDIDGIERLVLSIGLSIVVASLIGLALNYTPFGIRLVPITISLSVLVSVLTIFAWFRRISVEEENRFNVTINNIIEYAKGWFIGFKDEGMSIKIIVIACFIFMSLALYQIKGAPATGYEISIYASTPPLVWVFLIGSIAGGIGIIVHQAFSEEENNFWLIGFFILILNNLIILSLHTLRGYFFYAGADPMCHLNLIKNLIESCNFESGNSYPAMHIFYSLISEICNINPDIIAGYLPAFLSILFLMPFMYLLAKSSLLEKGQVLLACAASCVLLFNSLYIMAYPHTFSVFLFPAIVYLYFRTLEKPSWQFSFLFILLLILLPFTHPSGSLTMIFLLIAMELARIAYDRRYNIKRSLSKISVNPIMISVITFFMWISSFRLFGHQLSSLSDSIFEPYKSLHFVGLMEAKARLEWTEVVEYNLKMYGDTIIYIFLASIAGAIILKRFFKKEKGTRYQFLLLVFFLTCIPIEYFFFIGVKAETAGRMLNLLYMMTVAPVLVGFVLYELFKNKKRSVAITAVIMILTLTFSVSVFSVYHSPWIFTKSEQITKMDVKGSEWLSEHRDSTLALGEMSNPCSLMIMGKKFRMGIPEHFGYSYHETLGESLALDSYVVIDKRCKMLNADPMIAKTRINIGSGWGFDGEDFDKLEHDPSVAKLYSNGEFDTFYVSLDKQQ